MQKGLKVSMIVSFYDSFILGYSFAKRKTYLLLMVILGLMNIEVDQKVIHYRNSNQILRTFHFVSQNYVSHSLFSCLAVKPFWNLIKRLMSTFGIIF
jgi:hypothetical protein